MKYSMIIASLALAALLSACAGDETASSDVTFTSAAPPPQSSPAPAASAAAPTASVQPINEAKSVSGSDAVSIVLSSEPNIELVTGGTKRTLFAELKDSGKRKYYDDTRAQIAEVKPSDDGFKVRTVDGALLWKVKVSEDKIKISDNEENLKPWVLKTGYPDKAKILDPSEAEIGEVRLGSSTEAGRIRGAAGSDVWTIDEGEKTGAWGVLLMDRIPRDHQTIIIAELLARGR